MIFENTLINVMGCCFFTFLGMCLAARRYHAGTPAFARDSVVTVEVPAATSH
jgi:hypothetical protein